MEIIALIIGIFSLLLALPFFSFIDAKLVLAISAILVSVKTYKRSTKRVFCLISITLSIFSLVLCLTNTTNNVSSQSHNKFDEHGTPIFNVGETWTVDNQWKLTIHSVKTTTDRNQYETTNPEQVVVVTYSYENLGYIDNTGHMDGLYIDLSPSGNASIVSENGQFAYAYLGNSNKLAEQIAVGQKCEKAQVSIGLNQATSLMKMTISKFDGNGKEQKAIYTLNIK